MIKVLVVDDEKWIRTWIVDVIEHSSLNMSVTIAAKNGVEAFSSFEAYPPDLIITDMKMPVEDGIKLLKKIREKSLGIKIIVISGYTSFEYTKEAIRSQVFEYLHKPINDNQLIQVLKKAKKAIESEKRNLDEEMRIEIETFTSKYVSQNRFNQLIDKIEHPAHKVLYNLNSLHLCVLKVFRTEFEIIDMNEVRENIRNELKGLIQGDLSFYTFDLNDRKRLIGVMIYCSKDYKISKEYFISSYEDLKEGLKKYGYIVRYEEDGEVYEFNKIPEAFRNLCTRFEIVDIKDFNKSIGELTVPYSVSYASNYDIEKEKLFLNYLDSVDILKSTELIINIFADISNDNLVNLKEIKKLCLELLITLEKYAKKQKMKFYEVFQFDMTELSSIDNFSNLEELIKWFDHIITRLCNGTVEMRSKSSKGLIEDIITYLEVNYDKNISTGDVAKHFYISREYLCRLFKRQMKENFTSYFTKIKINKAQMLIFENTFNIIIISEMLGFEDVNYFIKVFKKYTGCTPGEFKVKGKI